MPAIAFDLLLTLWLVACIASRVHGASSTDAASRIANILVKKHKIDRIAYLPCNKLRPLVSELQNIQQQGELVKFWDITRESAGLAMCFGYNLGGRGALVKSRSCLLVQNTAIGNLITELLTLPQLYQVPLPIILSWRGHYKEPIEAQSILGTKMVDILEALHVSYTIVESENDIDKVDEALKACFENEEAHVILVSPRTFENCDYEPDTQAFGLPKLEPVNIVDSGYDNEPDMTRYEAIKTIVESLSDEQVLIPQIGFPARETYAAITSKNRHNSNNDRTLYLLGALGSASLVGLGYALARPDLHITVMDGDGAMLFNPNQMLELGQYMPTNLRIVVLDNGAWGSTGNQPTLASFGTNVAAIGEACGMPPWRRVANVQEWKQAALNNEKVIHFMIKSGNANVGPIDLSAKEIMNRFYQATQTET